jgi:serine/tyrosine/threonine adenylyltransferase
VAVREPKVSILNHRLGEQLGLNLHALSPDAAARLFAGQELPAGSQPIAQAYAGHQYGGFTMLGDGRAILLGEHRTPAGGLFDLQFKGSGPTPFSRRGDGRAALGPMLREHVVSEAMAALGIPTTRSLAVVTTGEPVYRSVVQPGAVLTRVAASHIRVGTFEYAAHRGDDTLRALADYAIARHDPELNEVPDKYLAFLRAVLGRQAALVAKWMHVGFIHGVMNTDNVAVSGETIDYGPCAFMNAYDPATVYSSIDSGGRYAFASQPQITLWNLARFAESLLPLLHPEPEEAVEMATQALGEFQPAFHRHWLGGMRRKLGLHTNDDADIDLANGLLSWMHAAKADYTNTFRDLATADVPFGDQYRQHAFLVWHARWRARLALDGQLADGAFDLMNSVNPAVIARNHRVEEVLTAAEAGDLAPLHRLLEPLQSPFDMKPEWAEYQLPPADETGYRTFCGT